MNSALMIFIDGIGIGKKDYEFNPFFKYGFKTFTGLFGEIPTLENPFINKNGFFIFPSDARLGVDGFPQSGTGQTSIFCGVNAPQIVGKHFGPYPYSTLIPVIKEKNIFSYYLSLQRPVSFANAYPKIFFDYLASGKQRLSVTSLSCRLSGIKLNRASDVRRGRALTAEITNERWNRRLGYNLPVIKPSTAARRLLKIAAQNSFTLYEYFLTDHFGHGRNIDEMIPSVQNLDRFLYTILTEADHKNLTTIICSDHGNFEDLSVKTHTFNPALTITAGRYAEEFASEIRDLTQIKGTITKYIK
jgi:hypothetical protein